MKQPRLKNHTVLVEMNIKAISQKDATDKIEQWFLEREEDIPQEITIHEVSKKWILDEGYFPG
jgi:hypothetical protein